MYRGMLKMSVNAKLLKIVKKKKKEKNGTYLSNASSQALTQMSDIPKHVFQLN